MRVPGRVPRKYVDRRRGIGAPLAYHRARTNNPVHASLGEDFDGRGGNEAGTEEEGRLRHC